MGNGQFEMTKPAYLDLDTRLCGYDGMWKTVFCYLYDISATPISPGNTGSESVK